jgi:2-methylcitrate dehydratase PrpD
VTGPTLSQQLADFATTCRDEHVPEQVDRSVRQRIVDVLGICVAARRLDTSVAVLGFVADTGGAPQASVVGEHTRVPAAQAAFANGVLAHSLDYDDTHLPSVLHPAASVIPAALAAAEAAKAPPRQLVAAIAAGIEITVRLGMAGYDRQEHNSLFFDRGQHATSICGALGSAAAAGLLSGLDAHGVAHAVGVAASFASGIIEGNRTGGTVKRMHCGWAAHAGVTAAELTRRGITGPPTALEGRFGLFQAFLSGRFNPDELLRDLGTDWEVPKIFFKPYPANHFTHAGIDAAIALRTRGLRPQDVDHAVLRVAEPTVRTIGEPLAAKQRPQTGYQAQFSGPYTVAAALIGGGGLGLGLGDFTDELATSPERRDLMARIRVESDPACDRIFPWQFPAILQVHTTDGRMLEEQVLTNRGGPDRPLSDTEILRKFTDNASTLLPAEQLARFHRVIDDLYSVTDVSALLEPLRLPREC